MLQGRIQLYLPDPVEGGPHGAPLAGFLFDKSPQRSTSSVHRAFLRSHEETPLSLQAPDFQAVLLEPDAKLLLGLLFAAVELYQQPTLCIANTEEGRVEAVQNVDVLDDRQHVVGHL